MAYLHDVGNEGMAIWHTYMMWVMREQQSGIDIFCLTMHAMGNTVDEKVVCIFTHNGYMHLYTISTLIKSVL